MNGNEIDMRMFAQRAGANVTFGAGNVVFNKGDPGSCMYIVQSGVIEMMIGDKVIEVCGPNEAIGFMSMIDSAPRSSTARVKEACELSLIDQRKFRFMVDEMPNFALHHGRHGPAYPRHEPGDVSVRLPSPGRHRAPAIRAAGRSPGSRPVPSHAECADAS